MPVETSTLSIRIAEKLRARNAVSRAFFPGQAPRLAAASRAMAERFLRGGRLLAFGRDFSTYSGGVPLHPHAFQEARSERGNRKK